MRAGQLVAHDHLHDAEAVHHRDGHLIAALAAILESRLGELHGRLGLEDLEGRQCLVGIRVSHVDGEDDEGGAEDGFHDSAPCVVEFSPR